MQIKIHRGTHRIGGCVTEITTKQARIVIDMGAELPVLGKAVSELELEGVTMGKPDCDGVFITHYHGDHVGMYDKVLPSVPIWMGPTAREIFSVVQRTVAEKCGKHSVRPVDFKTFYAGKPIVLKDTTITPFMIDHSAFDAYMFLIEAEGRRVLHTGDFRMHGARGAKMSAVFEKYARYVDVLIVEGTMMGRRDEKILTEHELGRRAREILRDERAVFVLCSSTNIDTIAEFYAAAIAENRMFIVCEDAFQLEILRVVTKNSRSSFYCFDRQKIYVYGENLHKKMTERGFCFIARTNRVIERALAAFPHNVLIYSMWTGYLDHSKPAFDAFKSKFVEEAVRSGSRLEFLHTSGHADA